METIKKGEVLKVNYIAIDNTTGLIDVYMHIYSENGNELGSGLSPILMTEDINGFYYATFTPDTVGQWRIHIVSVSNFDDYEKTYEVVEYTTDDIKAQTQNIEDKIDIIDTNINTIKTKTDNLPTDTAAVLTAIQDKLNDLDSQINQGGYIL